MAGGTCVVGACMAGGMHAMHNPHTMRYGWSMRGRYASFWNAFLFTFPCPIIECVLLQVQNTYYLPYDARIPKEHEDKENIGYYQWVGFFLCVQAICFYLPRTLWGLFNTKAGMTIVSNQLYL